MIEPFSSFGDALGALGEGMGFMGELVIVHGLRLINRFACHVHWFKLHVWAFNRLQWWKENGTLKIGEDSHE